MEILMPIIPKKAKDCLKKFVEWGGLVAVIVYLANLQVIEAVIFAVGFGILVVLLEKYFSKMP